MRIINKIIKNIFTKPGLIIGLVLMIYSPTLLSQTFWNDLNVKVGLSTFNHYDYGGNRTNYANIYREGYGLTPSFGVSYELNDKYYLSTNYEYSWLMSFESLPGNQEWLENTTSTLIFGGYRRISSFSIGLLISGINHSGFRTTVYSGPLFNRIGTGLSIGYSNDETSIYFNQDIVFDFYRIGLTGWTEYLSLRVLKNLNLNSHKKKPIKNEITKAPKVIIGFGTEMWIDHHSSTKLFTPSLFASIELRVHKIGLFNKRALALSLEGSWSETSFYTVSNNLGLSYQINNNDWVGISYLTDNDNYQRQVNDLQGKPFIIEAYFISGMSAHYHRAISSQLFLTSQLDYIASGLRSTALTYSPIQLRLGIMKTF